jgi:hypothetical protein
LDVPRVLHWSLRLCVSGAALAKDSAQIVCSGIASFDYRGNPEKIGIFIYFLDVRAEGGKARKYTLFSIRQSKLFQGSVIDRSVDSFQGKIALRNVQREFYVGSFKLERGQDDNYTMSLDGKINDDPAGRKTLYPIKAKLPCVDLSI